MGEEKPKPKRFSGMKKKPYANPHNKKKKSHYKPLTFRNRTRGGLSDLQKERLAEFLKVREGETVDEWKKRTKFNRIIDIDDVEGMRFTKRLRVTVVQKQVRDIENKNRYLRVRLMEREFDFMRYYGIVINYYSIKYGIRVEDFQLGFYFYSGVPFTKNRFDNAAVLHLGTSRLKLKQFIDKGFVEEMTTTKLRYKESSIVEKTSMYRLTANFIDKLTYIYRTLGKMNIIRMNQPVITALSPEEKQIIMDMNDEIMDIHTGRKSVQK